MESYQNSFEQFESQFNQACNLMLAPCADETKPYEEKYQAKDSFMKLNIIMMLEPGIGGKIARALCLYKIGIIFYETEENAQSLQHSKDSLTIWQSLPEAHQRRHINSIQDVYNQIAIVLANREDQTQDCLFYLKKSQETYKLKEKPAEAPDSDLAQMPPTIQGNTDLELLERNLTQTYFYFAQVYSKSGNVVEGINFCGKTMQRQVATNTFTLKDFVLNCISMSDYFISQNNFAQSEYLLCAATIVLPSDTLKRKKLRGTVQICMGNYYLQLLTWSIKNQDKKDSDINSLRQVEFPELKIKWPEVSIIKNSEQGIYVFKLANTKLQKALKQFVVDGYVTEHVRITQSLSKLYKQLAFLETDRHRIFSLLDRRIKLIRPLKEILNPTAYYVYIQEFSFELSEIYGDIFDLHWNAMQQGLEKPTKKKQLEANTACLEQIKHAKFVTASIYASADKFEYLQAVLNMELQAASRYTKLFCDSVQEQVENMKLSLQSYEQVKAFVALYKKEGQNPVISSEIQQQIAICDEMIELLPIKIQKTLKLQQQ